MTLEQWRLRAGMTQQELADKVGVNRITIIAWENADNQPRAQYLRPLADALGITPAQVFDAIQETKQKR